MVARLSIATISIAALVALAAACGGADKSPGATPTGLATARLNPAPTATLAYTRLVKPVSESDGVWDQITARVSGNFSPVLRPPSPPEGFDTVEVTLNDNYFTVEYTGPDKHLRMHVGMLSNPGEVTSAGHQERVNIRGIDCKEEVTKEWCPFLQVSNDANPKESSFLLWYEPGHEVFPGAQPRNEVEYFLIGEGVEPPFLIDFANSLTAQ